jgi:hypothetical protein
MTPTPEPLLVLVLLVKLPVVPLEGAGGSDGKGAELMGTPSRPGG